MTKEETENQIMEWLQYVADGTYKPDEIYANFKDLFASLTHQVDQRGSQLKDINQWSQMLLNQRDLTPNVIRGIVGSINNRTTD